MPARCEVRKAKDEAIPQDGRLCMFRIGPTVLSVITVGLFRFHSMSSRLDGREINET